MILKKLTAIVCILLLPMYTYNAASHNSNAIYCNGKIIAYAIKKEVNPHASMPSTKNYPISQYNSTDHQSLIDQFFQHSELFNFQSPDAPTIENALVAIDHTSQSICGFLEYKTTATSDIYIEFLATHPDFRRKGIAQNLLQTVEAQHQTARAITLIVAAQNTQAIELYKKIGFQIPENLNSEQTLF